MLSRELKVPPSTPSAIARSIAPASVLGGTTWATRMLAWDRAGLIDEQDARLAAELDGGRAIWGGERWRFPPGERLLELGGELCEIGVADDDQRRDIGDGPSLRASA